MSKKTERLNSDMSDDDDEPLGPVGIDIGVGEMYFVPLEDEAKKSDGKTNAVDRATKRKKESAVDRAKHLKRTRDRAKRLKRTRDQK